MKIEGYISGTEAAKIIGVTRSRISQLCKAGTINCQKLGKIWVVLIDSARSYRDNNQARIPGRKKTQLQ